MTVTNGSGSKSSIDSKQKTAKKKMKKRATAIAADTTAKAVKLTPFATSVYDKCKQIPEGRVSTYKDIAAALDNPKAFRAVGTALKKNPFAPVVPCHRVVASDRSLGGFFGSTDISGSLLRKKKEMLMKETVKFDDDGKVCQVCVHDFETQS